MSDRASIERHIAVDTHTGHDVVLVAALCLTLIAVFALLIALKVI